MKKILYIFLVMLLTTSTVNASLFGNILDRFYPQQEERKIIYTDTTTEKNSFKLFLDEIVLYNTPTNVELISKSMNDYGINNLEVYVSDYDSTFYVVPWIGITLQKPETIAKKITLSRSQIKNIENYIADEKITNYEWLQIWWMYRQ